MAYVLQCIIIVLRHVNQGGYMHLSDANFFGKQAFESVIVEYPPYQERITLIRYGYESAGAIYDVVIAPRPLGPDRIVRWYKINGRTSLTPHAIHIAIEKHFSL
jgi:hypothetical protein